MNIYHVERSGVAGYNEYSDFVIVCQDAETARNTHPDGMYFYSEGCWRDMEENESKYCSDDWVNPDNVSVTLLGIAHGEEKRIVCSSFHAA